MTLQQSKNAAPTGVSRDIIVIGASAGGVETLGEVVKHLPADLAASVFVVLHISPSGTSILPSILSRRGPLPARTPQDGEPIRHGVIYVAPPDHHLLVDGEHVRVSRGPSENRHRPAIDPLFRSAARSAKSRVIAVVLSGMLDDGTAGLLAVKRYRGTTVVQDPDDALFSGMPTSAIENMTVDHIVPASEIGALLTRLVAEPGGSESETMNNKETGVPQSAGAATQDEATPLEVSVALMEPGTSDIEDKPDAAPSVYACPECGGVLWESHSPGVLRFRCRTGHAYSADSLLAEQTEALEDALWSALRALEESGSLAKRLLGRARERGHTVVANRYEQQATEAAERAARIRNVLLHGEIFTG